MAVTVTEYVAPLVSPPMVCWVPSVDAKFVTPSGPVQCTA